MPGMLRKSMLYLGLVDDEEEYVDGDGEYADQYGDSYPPEPGYQEPVPVSGTRGLRTVDRQERVTGVSFAGGAPAARQAPPVARITTLHPRTYNDARGIGEEFRRGAPVIMNLTEMDEADAKRLVDFAAGLTFGLRGRIEKVTKGVFLLSPHGVDVTLEAETGVVSGGFYNQS
jgi:cell division inhibitor SepF